MGDWTPTSYDRFADVRMRPALDLLAQVGDVPEGELIDLGCGSGAMAAALGARYPGQRRIGIDRSPAMLKAAAGTGDSGNTGAYDALEEADIAHWQPKTPPALIYSNAALQWLGAHEALLPRLARTLRAGGVLAVQMPYQNAAPSHRGWGAAFSEVFGKVEVGGEPRVLAPEMYADLLAPFGAVQLWETRYYQHLPAAEDGHPVRLFTQSTFGRPFLEAAGDAAAQARLIGTYEAGMAKAYPRREDGSVLFPFRRMFFVLRRSPS